MCVDILCCVLAIRIGCSFKIEWIFQFSELNATNDSISLTVSLNDKLNDIVVSEYNFDIDIPETDKTITTQTTPLATTTNMPSFKVL